MMQFRLGSYRLSKGPWVSVAMGPLLVGLALSRGVGLEINGVQPYALDQPRVPALLTPASGGAPLWVYSELHEQRLFAFDCFLDTGASRMVMSRSDRDALKLRATGQSVEDFGIAGTEHFDVSIPYRMYVGNSAANPADVKQFTHGIQCVLQLRRSDQNPLTALPKSLTGPLTSGLEGTGLSSQDLGDMLTEAVNIVGTPFLRNYVAILDPRPVVSALGAVIGMLGGGGGDAGGDGFGGLDKLLGQLEKSGSASASLGRMKVDLVPANRPYAATQIVVPLTMQNLEPKPVPVTKSDLPFVSNVVLSHGSRSARVSLLVDTGGGMSLLSSRVAQQLGVDLRRPQLTAFVQGVGKGGTELKGHWIGRATIPTTKGGPLVYNRLPFYIADIAGIDGTIGVNMLVPSVYMDMDMNKMMENPMGMLTSMKNGPMPFSRIVIDLPRQQLGLDPAQG
ncbi:MAG: hypothetical protein COZ06_12025 [Armatimonadetes bacterium CG_4_10_14_3_um_filter_66_18]|nr:hypothetical protein [Armatimonadota bacterium]OIO93853.1 MAG: hypothetical protein AUJ96_29570 [Armatimonadetes bacterium CG2_30_66_41]PIU87759.1 MAG: hypothetical protein COS65_33020 [Armatimonadetes bacterium CG06_land_8_20_14_3_00_66_21]PIX41189.1 MAG: hypothetical protein COZ57_24045 [Armatimonadetes bacterium CG_4_8_14_3_um_filter_66_20]PIY49925.1 MAG: hypothetical protein COZ06_12025 [Armatimonadetes bacterium CG_4_10_14_3_um_filter_66_18]PIZ43583.1 MAG: hypothetical protein COY42_15